MSPHPTVLIVTDADKDHLGHEYALLHGENPADTMAYRILRATYDTPIVELIQSQSIDHSIDHIVIDLHSPQLCSVDIVRQLNDQLGGQSPPIIVIDRNEANLAIQNFRQGAADYLIREQTTSDDLHLALRRSADTSRPKRFHLDGQQQSERHIRHGEHQVRRVLDGLFSFVGVMTPDGILIEANQTALSSAALQPSDVIGRPFEQTYWWAYSTETQVQLRSAINRAAAGEVVRYDVQVRLGTDHFIMIDFALVPLLDEQGRVEYLIPSGIDITDRKKLEVSLRESQTQLQQQLAEIEAIYQSAPIGLNVLDADFRFIRINQRLAEINGLSVEAHIGRTVRELLPNLADTAEQLLRPILETGEPLLNVEIHGETPAQPGVQRTWLEHFLPLKQGDRVTGISTVCEEITERVQNVAALRQSEERFRNMADHAPMMVWVTDPTGYCTYLSQSWYEFTGLPENTGLGFAWLDVLHPDDYDHAKQIFLDANQRQDAFRLEYRLRHWDGEYRWAIDAANPWFSENGEFKGYIGSVMDISDRKQAEANLRQSEERYRTLFESMNEGFCVIEMLFNDQDKPIDYRFVEINPIFEEQTGLSQAEGRTARQLLPDLEDHWFEIYGTVAVTGEPIRIESVSDVMNRWFEVSAFRIGAPEQRKVALLFKNISDRKLAEQERERLLAQEKAARTEAERANRVKDEFLAVLSHELRSPLNPILGWTQLLQTRQFEPPKMMQALATIERNVKLQIQLIDDLLDIAKILRGKLSLTTESVHLSVVVDSALDTVRTAALAKSISLNATLPDIGQISGDAARLQQVVWNLLSNAIKFTPPSGQVTIQLEQVGHQAQLTVRDTGKGISPEFLPHIFESFRQEDTSTTRKYGGLGLGLAIVRQLVEAHGGTIAAESPGDGLGATFTLRLPLLNTEPQAQLPPPAIPLDPDLVGIRVLSVDDDPDTRDLLQVLLTHYGMEVSVVTTAADVLGTIASFRPHVLISDIGMPDMNGYALIQQIRTLPPEQGGQVMAIAITAYAREEDRQLAFDCGYQRHMTKPFDPEQLIQALVDLTFSLKRERNSP